MYQLPQELKGSSVLEVILALAVFSLIAASLISMTAGSFGGLVQGGEQTQAEALAQEGIEAVRSIYAEAWNNLAYSTSSVSVSDGEWVFDGEDTTEPPIGKFTRSISFTDVCRDLSDDIVDCPGAYTDIYTKKVLVTVSWSPRATITNVVTKEAYITNWESREWIQTDWGGRDGQSVWDDIEMFASSTEVDTSSPGEIRLGSAAGGSWANAGGDFITQTSVSDFSSGVHSSTTVIGFGSFGGITLLSTSSEYVSEGAFVSEVIDSGEANADWANIFWVETLSEGSEITLSTRSGDTAIPGESWSGWSAEMTDATSSVIESPSSRYLQYRVSFTLGENPAETPQLDEVKIIFNPPTIENLSGLSAVSDSDIWASTANGTILHYNENTWSEDASLEQPLNDVSMISPSEGYVVGDNGIILSYNGSLWNDTDTGDENWNAVSMVSTSSVFVVGDKVGIDGTVATFDGLAWTVSTIPDLDANLYGVHALSATDVWAVGELGKIIHYDGLSWSEFPALGGDAIRDIFMLNDSDGWAVGDNGKIYRYNGSDWILHTNTGEHTWNAVELLDSNQGWVVGNNGAIFEWNGDVWSEIVPVVGQDLYGLSIISGDDIWAVGANGSIAHYSTGATYQSAGYLTSSAYDMGGIKTIQGIEWDAIVPECNPECTVVLQLSAAPDVEGIPGQWTDWYGADGVGSYFTNATGTLVTTDLSTYQWVRYRAILTGDGDGTPVLEEVRINHK